MGGIARRTQPAGALARRWRLDGLGDFWALACWLERQQRRGRATRGLETALARTTEIVSRSVERYRVLLRALDAETDGALSDPSTAANPTLGVRGGNSLLEEQEQNGAEIAAWLEQVSRGDPETRIRQWEQHLDSPAAYRHLLTRLVHDFGNFEAVSLALPGTGTKIVDARVQAILEEMFRINRRLIRLLELVGSVRQERHPETPRSTLGFFRSDFDLSRQARHIVLEYMIESDPERIATARRRARAQGRRSARYRFWRPAETLRQLARVRYLGARQRRPRPRRRYLELAAHRTPSVCADARRLDWAIKEVLNNALAATARIGIEDGQMHVDPLPRHDTEDPEAAVRVRAEEPRRGQRGAGRTARLVIEDQGPGIDPEVLPYVTMWAFSARRAGQPSAEDAFSLVAEPPWGRRRRPREDEASTETNMEDETDEREATIGGKGIGLPFARATVEEMGGALRVDSTPGEGTTVTIDLPAPSPFTL